MVKSRKIHCAVCNTEVINQKRDTLLDQFQVCKTCHEILAVNQQIDHLPYDDFGFV